MPFLIPIETISTILSDACFITIPLSETSCFCLRNNMFPKRKQFISLKETIVKHTIYQLIMLIYN